MVFVNYYFLIKLYYKVTLNVLLYCRSGYGQGNIFLDIKIFLFVKIIFLTLLCMKFSQKNVKILNLSYLNL